MKLQSKGNVTQLRAELLVKRKKRSTSATESWEVVRARGHLDEVQALRAAGSAEFDASQPAEPLALIEGTVLGGGAFSRVSVVTGMLHSTNHYRDQGAPTQSSQPCRPDRAKRKEGGGG
jgi:cGMP-dependent protein kinase 2